LAIGPQDAILPHDWSATIKNVSANMKSSKRVLVGATALLLAGAVAKGEQRSGPFTPLAEWKTAVMAGDQAALARLYSANPPAVVQVGKDKVVNLEEELRFWAGLKSAGVTGFNPKLLDLTMLEGHTKLRLRIQAVKADEARPMVASMVQIWLQEPDGWRITASRRGEFSPEAVRRLPQPATPNPDLYSDPKEAEAELRAAEGVAAREHKRVLVVFGANWCYDCHVLDTTFRSKEFAPLVDANYVVVHINTGEEGKDNYDLAARLGVALDHGIPSLGVLEPDGRVVVAQKDGEFESTVKIGPEDVRAFLEKWKAGRK
jgi:ketosteroid isomerase-like protein